MSKELWYRNTFKGMEYRLYDTEVTQLRIFDTTWGIYKAFLLTLPLSFSCYSIAVGTLAFTKSSVFVSLGLALMMAFFLVATARPPKHSSKLDLDKEVSDKLIERILARGRVEVDVVTALTVYSETYSRCEREKLLTVLAGKSVN